MCFLAYDILQRITVYIFFNPAHKDNLKMKRWKAVFRRFAGAGGGETLTMRQATQHGCLPSLLGERDKVIEIVYGGEKNILYFAD
jgi:hypothetical protein